MPTGLCFPLLLLLCCGLHSISAVKETKFLHVLSANKFYVPDFNRTSKEFQAPKNLTYEYFLKNALDIPNSVKLELFILGEQLRVKYGNFIGSLYTDEVIKMQTVGFPASIIAAELINAGLWPPVDKQIWKDDLLWQPVPFDYKPANEDTLLLGGLCPNFEQETHKVIENYKSSEAHKTLLEHIRVNGTINVQNPIDVLMLQLALDNSKELNQTLPQWTNQIYPSSELNHLSLAAYDLLSTSTLQKRLNGGTMLKKITNDWKNHINGSLSKYRKIHIYSGDDRNLAGVMKNLNLTLKELPKPGDALVFELIEEYNEHYVQIWRYVGDVKKWYPYKVPGCVNPCRIERFNEFIADILPDNELSLCGYTINNETTGKGTANSISNANTLLSFVTLIMLYLCTKV